MKRLSIKIGQRYFQLTLALSLVCGVGMVILCLLGNWQLHRYHYKQTLLSNFQNHLKKAPQELSTLLNLPRSQLAFTHVTFTVNKFNSTPMLLINRTHHGQVGADVLSLVSVAGHSVLVDRGFVALHPNDDPKIVLPIIQHNELSTPKPMTLTGYIKLPEYQFILGKNILNPQQHPLMMQKIDLNELQTILQIPLLPFIIRLDPNSHAGFIRDWPVTTVLPQRHLAYAWQWYGMAVGLLIIYLLLSTSIGEEKSHEKA
ncbi:MAG: SURF1 family protein [Legionellales bacterium]|nr:SURF1 family protein [Legionellales bacterium]